MCVSSTPKIVNYIFIINFIDFETSGSSFWKKNQYLITLHKVLKHKRYTNTQLKYYWFYLPVEKLLFLLWFKVYTSVLIWYIYSEFPMYIPRGIISFNIIHKPSWISNNIDSIVTKLMVGGCTSANHHQFWCKRLAHIK